MANLSVHSAAAGNGKYMQAPSTVPMYEFEGFWVTQSHHGTKWLEQVLASWSVARPFVKNFRTAVDVGACFGMFTRLLSSEFEKVWAIEPNPYLYPCLVKNVAENVFIVPYALGEQERNVAVTAEEKDAAVPSVRVYTDREGRIQMTTLDKLAPSIIDFLKIDVEGMEDLVLRGGERIIERDHPVILMECKGHWKRYKIWGGANPEYWLSQHGYREVAQSTIDKVFVYEGS